MTTKNLARSLFERGCLNRGEIRYIHRRRRIAFRDFCRKVEKDIEISNEIDIDGDCYRRSICKESNFNIKPVWQFLTSNIGKPWNKVWSELCHKYDKRKFKNQRLLKFVQKQVGIGKRRSLNRNDLYVDTYGILRKNVTNHTYWEIRRAEWAQARLWLAEQSEFLVNFLNGRKITMINGVLYWKCSHYPTEVNIDRFDIIYKSYDDIGRKYPSFFISGKLAKDEVNIFRNIPQILQEKLLACSLIDDNRPFLF